MLSQIVRPLVQTQIRLLANTQATYSVLIKTISNWLGYLGVEAKVTQLLSESNKIHISLTVGKPESCEPSDWQKILQNLQQSSCDSSNLPHPPLTMEDQIQLGRLLAYLIQVENPGQQLEWENVKGQLESLNLEEMTISSIKSALKVPQSVDTLLKKLNPDVATIAFPLAVSIAMRDQQVNKEENETLTALLQALHS